MLVTAGHCTFDWKYSGQALRVKASLGHGANTPDSQQREGSRIGVLRPWLLSHDSVKPENGIPYPEAKILAVNSEPAMEKPPIRYITMNIPEEIYPLSKINPIPPTIFDENLDGLYLMEEPTKIDQDIVKPSRENAIVASKDVPPLQLNHE